MARQPADYKEWRSRRNQIAESLCAAFHRQTGEVCSCFNGDEKPDEVHFEHCKKMVNTANVALRDIGVNAPAK